ncbi:MAG: hypothetical protein M1553_13395, partial [Firmicutes bacterium]|nr:hypothetical protein [Bacillota bacterium]
GPRPPEDIYPVTSQQQLHPRHQVLHTIVLARLYGGKIQFNLACFDSPSWYELLVEGRKVVGSAQVRKQETILQHGSILLDLDVDLLMEVLAFPSPAVRTRTRRVLAGKAGSLRDYLGKEATFERVSQAMAQGFAKALGIELIPADLQDEEKKLAEELAREKYAADWWLERA